SWSRLGGFGRAACHNGNDHHRAAHAAALSHRARGVMAMPGRILYWLTAAAIAVVVLFPLYFMFISSLRSGAEQFEVAYLPSVIRLENYARLLKDRDFLAALLNSVIVSTAVAFVTVMISILAGYAIARISFTGRALVA